MVGNTEVAVAGAVVGCGCDVGDENAPQPAVSAAAISAKQIVFLCMRCS
jgi:hypothetical protein